MAPNEYTVRTKIEILLSLYKNDLSLLLIFTHILLCIGFLFGTGDNANYDLLYDIGNHYVWAGIFGTTALVKIYSIYWDPNNRVGIVNSTVSVWAWIYIFLSFVVFDPTPVAPTEILMLVPAIIEIWVLLSKPLKKNCKPEGTKDV